MKFLLIGLIISSFFCSCSSVRLKHFEASKCQDYCYNGIISESVEKNTTTIVYGTGANCCHKFKGKAWFRNDTLYLESLTSGTACKCRCSYELTYKIKGLKSSSYEIVHLRKKRWGHKRHQKLKALRNENPERYERIRKRRSIISSAVGQTKSFLKYDVLPVIKVIFTEPEE